MAVFPVEQIISWGIIIISLLAAVTSFRVISRIAQEWPYAKTSQRKFLFYLLSFGIMAWSAGEIISQYAFLTGQGLSSPAVADVFYIAAYALFFPALEAIYVFSPRNFTAKQFFTYYGATLAVLIATFYAITVSLLNAMAQHPFAVFLSYFYPVGAALLSLSMLKAYFMVEEVFHSPLQIFGLAIFSIFTATLLTVASQNLASLLAVARGLFVLGDILLFASMFLFLKGMK